jgi:transcriptional regulator with XRE-family HTH domain
MEHALTKFRRKHRLSVRDLAREVGVSAATVSRIETGKQNPSMALLVKLVEASKGKLKADDFLPKQAA